MHVWVIRDCSVGVEEAVQQGLSEEHKYELCYPCHFLGHKYLMDLKTRRSCLASVRCSMQIMASVGFHISLSMRSLWLLRWRIVTDPL